MTNFAAFPKTLKDLPHFVVWKYEERNGKTTKPPYDAKTGKPAKANDPATWTTFETAVKAADILSGNSFDGIGFELLGTNLVGVDFDGVIDEAGNVDPYVLNIIEQLGNPYAEITPSGNGIRCFVECDKLPSGGRKFSNGDHYGVEIYIGNEGGRYLTTTGNKLPGSGDGIPTLTPEQIEIPYFLIKQFSNTKLKKLWMGDASGFANDQSRADLALCDELVKLLGKDPMKVERYFNASALCDEKWTSRPEYREWTITKALSMKSANANEKLVKAANDGIANHKLDLIPLSDIESEIQEWLWDHRIPKGALTNLSGDADNGKSMVLYDILARISSGADFPDGAANPYGGEPRKVILLFSEGSLKTTVKPRMTVMGANMSNVLTLKSVSIKGEKDETKRQFYLKTDLDLLRKALQQDPSIAVIGFDPLTNYLDDDCNMNKSQDVRRVLTPLCELAEEFGVTIIAIIHFSKNIAMNAIHRTGGAAALVEVPRAAWCCIKDDDPENADNFIFARIKNNLGKRTGGLSYRIDETFITIKGRQASQPKLIWGARNDKSADELLTMQKVPEMKGVAKAKAWLQELLKDGKARKSTGVYAAALAQGITEDCIKNANRVLRTETKRYAERWYMRRWQGESVPWTYVNDLDDHSNEPVPAADDGEPL